MTLDYVAIAELEKNVMERLPQTITHILSKLNRTGKLHEFLELIDMIDLLAPTHTYQTYRDGKILIIGSSEIKESVITAVAKSFGIEVNRLELCIDYDEAASYQFDKLQYQPQYRVILCGPMPHSIRGKNDSSSMIAEMERKAGYPRVLRLEANGVLKITKSSLRQALTQLKEENYI
ncbi:MAG: hypothetical protein ACOX36_07515 [Saccharofermentanales bacterium]|jgi:hypothetical protein